jgi:hypothetical protein
MYSNTVPKTNFRPVFCHNCVFEIKKIDRQRGFVV